MICRRYTKKKKKLKIQPLDESLKSRQTFIRYYRITVKRDGYAGQLVRVSERVRDKWKVYDRNRNTYIVNNDELTLVKL